MPIDPTIPFGEFAPDKTPYFQGILNDVKNALPQGTHYSSCKDLSAMSSNSLPSNPLGAIAFRNFNNNTKIYVGSKSALYEYNNGGYNDVSKAGGYVGNDFFQWEFLVWNDKLIATNFNDPVQEKDLSQSGNFNELQGNPPRAKHMGRIGQFLVLGNLATTQGEFNNMAQWCGIGDLNEWSNNADLQSGSQFFNDTGGGQITKITSGSQYGYIFQENAISRLTYVGGAVIFRNDTLEKNKGTRIPTSVLQKGTRIYYIGKDGFYMFNGSSSSPIGENKIDNFFYNDLNRKFTHKISVGYDEHLIFWSYPSKESTDGNCDKMLVYNEYSNTWSKIEIETNLLFSSLSLDVGLEDLAKIYSSIDAVNKPFDSPSFIGGQPLFCAFNKTNNLCTFEGSTLPAEFTTAEFQYERGQVTKLQKIASILTGQSKMQIGIRDKLSDNVTWETEITANDSGYFMTLATAPFHRVKVTSIGDFGEASGVQILEATPQGVR